MSADALLSMALATALQYIDPTRRRIRRVVKLTFSGSYTTGGETLDFTTQTNPNNWEMPKWARKPTGFDVENSTPGYKFEILPGTLLTNWKVKITDLTNAGAELAQSAYPAAITGDTNIRFSFSGPIGV